MSKPKSGIVLSEGEEVILDLEAELWASSSNPIAQFFGSILRIIYMILGCTRKGYIVLTNERLVEIAQTRLCYVFNSSKAVKYVLPASIKEVGYTKEATCCGCFCQAYTLYYDAFTQRTAILLKGEDEKGAQRIVDEFYRFIQFANKK